MLPAADMPIAAHNDWLMPAERQEEIDQIGRETGCIGIVEDELGFDSIEYRELRGLPRIDIRHGGSRSRDGHWSRRRRDKPDQIRDHVDRRLLHAGTIGAEARRHLIQTSGFGRGPRNRNRSGGSAWSDGIRSRRWRARADRVQCGDGEGVRLTVREPVDGDRRSATGRHNVAGRTRDLVLQNRRPTV